MWRGKRCREKCGVWTDSYDSWWKIVRQDERRSTFTPLDFPICSEIPVYQKLLKELEKAVWLQAFSPAATSSVHSFTQESVHKGAKSL